MFLLSPNGSRILLLKVVGPLQKMQNVSIKIEKYSTCVHERKLKDKDPLQCYIILNMKNVVLRVLISQNINWVTRKLKYISFLFTY